MRAPSAAELYHNDFQTSAGPEWSSAPISAAPADGTRLFLGRFNNETVTLRLGGLAAHTQVTLEFDLYVIGTWDGIDSYPYGPDRWTLGVQGGPILLDTSFSNVTSPPFGIPFAQNYPDPWQTAVHGQFTGAIEARTLGYIFSGYDVSAVYHLTYVVPSTDTSIAFDFTAAMGQEYGGPHDIDEESWGLDNVHVTSDAVAGVASGGDPLAGIRLSPNPCRTACRLSLGRHRSEEVAAVTLLDPAGRAVRRQAPVARGDGAIDVPVTGLHAGIYFARIEGRNGRVLGTGRIAVVR